MWDDLYIPPPSQVLRTNGNNLNAESLNCISEKFDQNLALEMNTLPVDFVSKDELAGVDLTKYKVLQITEPNILSRGQQA